MQNLTQNIKIVNSLINKVNTADANGTGVDLQGFESAMAVVSVGAEGDTLAANLNFQVRIEHSDDNSTFTRLVQADIVNGTIAANGVWLILDGTTGGDPGTAGDNWQVGYVGGKRYVRLVLFKTGTHSTGTPLSGNFVLSRPRNAPTPNVIHNV